MQADRTIIDACSQELSARGLNGPALGREWDRLADLVDEYELACLLSRGTDPNRSAHWSDKSQVIERRLKRRLNRRLLQEATCVGR